jgi:hypothetical protein
MCLVKIIVDGIFKRFMDVSQGKKKVVAYTRNHYIINIWCTHRS